jgi:hypothetical protein
MDIIQEYLTYLNEGIKIPLKVGALGLSLDDSLDKYKNQILSGKKKWLRMSKELNTLFIYNKNHHPDIAAKARGKRIALAKWVESKRKNNPDFGL